MENSVVRPSLAIFGGGAAESLVVVARQFLDAAVTYAQGDLGHRQPRMLHQSPRVAETHLFDSLHGRNADRQTASLHDSVAALAGK